MKLTDENINKLHRKYAKNDKYLKIVIEHCTVVNEIAQWIAENIKEDVDVELLHQACLIHDIASSAFMSETDFDFRFYQMHGILGSRILLDEGVDPRIAEMVANHLSVSVTKQDVDDHGLKLPSIDHTPKTLESRIMNYADEFHSKDPKFNRPETVIERYKNFLPTQVNKFKSAMEEFGVPDLEALSRKYNHPIR
jgi:uncharacterized protein